MASKSNAQKLFDSCVENVERRWGRDVKDLVGPAIYGALVAERIFHLVAGLDDQTDPATVVRVVNEMHTCFVDATS